MLAKAPVKHIPFRGGNPAMMGLLQGDITVLASTATGNLTRNVQNGDVIGVGIAATERWPSLPDVPTFTEAGYPGPPAASWTGFFAPAGTPEAVLAKLSSEINAIVQEAGDRQAHSRPPAWRRPSAPAPTPQSCSSTDISNWSTMVKAVGLAKP